jgi:hypothetical protein
MRDELCRLLVVQHAEPSSFQVYEAKWHESLQAYISSAFYVQSPC